MWIASCAGLSPLGRTALLLCLSLCLLHAISVQAAPCASFAQRCSASLNKVVGDSSGAAPVQLAQGKAYYLSFTPTEEVPFVDLDLMLLFGAVEVYAAKNREPKRSDYDFSGR